MTSDEQNHDKVGITLSLLILAFLQHGKHALGYTDYVRTYSTREPHISSKFEVAVQRKHIPNLVCRQLDLLVLCSATRLSVKLVFSAVKTQQKRNETAPLGALGSCSVRAVLCYSQLLTVEVKHAVSTTKAHKTHGCDRSCG